MAAGRVIIVEDDEDTLLFLGMLLKDSVSEIHTARTIAEAKNLLTMRAFDLVILDNWLPDGNGYELCRKLRQCYPDLPIIFYSAAAFPSDLSTPFHKYVWG